MCWQRHRQHRHTTHDVISDDNYSHLRENPIDDMMRIWRSWFRLVCKQWPDDDALTRQLTRHSPASHSSSPALLEPDAPEVLHKFRWTDLNTNKHWSHCRLVDRLGCSSRHGEVQLSNYSCFNLLRLMIYDKIQYRHMIRWLVYLLAYKVTCLFVCTTLFFLTCWLLCFWKSQEIDFENDSEIEFWLYSCVRL